VPPDDFGTRRAGGLKAIACDANHQVMSALRAVRRFRLRARVGAAARRRRLAAVLFALTLGASPGAALAARVLVLDRDGAAIVRDDPYLAASTAITPPVRTLGEASQAAAHTAGAATVRGILSYLYHRGQIAGAVYLGDSAQFNSAVREASRLGGQRGTELEAVIENLHTIAANGQLTPSRLPVLFLTLKRNQQWWASGPLLSYGQRVEFAGSDLVWEYYPGQGIELQQLGSFGKADWWCTAGPAFDARCARILAELIPLAARRGGGLTWEYYFDFDGGVPPWTSAMSQGTALQTLADAAKQLHDRSYLAIAQRALPVFTRSPPTGVAVPTARGARYVQYSFDAEASDEVINGFLQSLIGLDDYAQTSGSLLAHKLFASGDAAALAELPTYVIGDWSLYQPGTEDSLDYHELVTGFVGQLCTMTHITQYCATAQHFSRDLNTPANLRLLTRRLLSRVPNAVRFYVSKPARVGITVIRAGRTIFLTSADFAYGVGSFTVPALAQTGTYTVQLDSTDLAGNYDQVAWPAVVIR
jgi:hypothetical protein